MAYRDDTYTGGFSHPVFNSQSTFKQIMDAIARPGTIAEITVAAVPPAPMGPAAGAIALTLADHDTLVHLSPAMIETGVQSWLAFHTGALTTDDRNEAAFAFVEVGGQMPPLTTFAAGTQDYPDRSTTLVLEITNLAGGEPFELQGPGIDGSTDIAPTGLPQHFYCMWRENVALFPRGIDVILAAGANILCLPRTTRLTRKGA